MHKTGRAFKQAINWLAVWHSVAMELIEDKLPPKFLTEDRIRTATLRALDMQIDLGLHVDIESLAVNLGGMKNDRLDLVVLERAGITVVEFKFPREPRQTQPPWPDHLGSFLADTYRLGALIGGGQVRHAIQVLVSGAAFLGFVRRRMTPLGLAAYQPGEHTPHALTLAPAAAARLAPTTRGKIQRYEALWRLTVMRTTEHEISGKEIWLAAYDVHGQRIGGL
jgi:hypothetical protein